MPDEQNVFTLLDSYRDKGSIDTVDLSAAASGAAKIIRYPLSLGEVKGGIPFTLFMPYKRPKSNIKDSFGQSRAIDAAGPVDLLYTTAKLPTPDFAIALPTPPSALKTTYQSNYDEINLGQTVGILGTPGTPASSRRAPSFGRFDGTGAAQGAAIRREQNAKAAGAVRDPAVTEFNNALSGAFSKNNFSGMLQQGSLALDQTILAALGAEEGAANLFFGQSDNPFTDRLFKNVEFRQHIFNYTFLPKKQQDSEHIDKIIQLFKYAMLPRPSSIVGFFEFPYEFQITHSIQATTFTLLPSVLETMETDFGGGTDSLKLFKATSGGKQYPTKITVNLAFKEMILLNRDRITSFRGEGFFKSDDGVKDKPGGAPGDRDVKRYRF